MEKSLTIFKDSDYEVEFIVDIDKFEFIEKANPENRYGMEDLVDCGEEGYFFLHDHINKGRLTIEVPQFVTIAPELMAEKYNKSVEEILLLTDFDLMVDQELLNRRLKYGELPTIEIAGHIFYPEARLDLLRPKDDFSTMGSRFDDLDSYYIEERNVYAFPYDPKTHEIAELDWEQLFEYPKGLLFVEIPFVRILDPVGWNRRWGFPVTHGLKEIGFQMEFKAKVIPWSKVGIDDLIAENKLRQPIKKSVEETYPQKKNRQGPKM